MKRVAQTQWVLAAGHHIGGEVGELGTKTFRRSVTGQLTTQVLSSLHRQDTVAVVVPTRFGARRSRMVQRMLQVHLTAQLPASASDVPGVTTSQSPAVRAVPLAERVARLEPPTAPASYLVEIEATCLTITALDFQDGAHVSRLFFDLPRSLLTTPEGIGQLLERIEVLAEDLGAPGVTEAEIIFYGELSPCTALATSLHRRKILAFVLEDHTLTDRKVPLFDDYRHDDDVDEELEDIDSDRPETDSPDAAKTLAGARTMNVEPTVLRPRPEDMKRSVDVGGLVEAWWPVALIGVIVLLIGGGLLTLLRPGSTTGSTEVISAAATEPADSAHSGDGADPTAPGSTFEVPSSTVDPASEPTTPNRNASSHISGAGLTMSFPSGWRRDERTSDKLVVVSEQDLPMRVMGVLQPVTPGIDHEDLVGELERLVSGQVTLSQLRPEVTIESVMVATYREQPDDRSEVLWHIRLVGDQQISVGCQYRGRLTTELRRVCEQAVASATTTEESE